MKTGDLIGKTITNILIWHGSASLHTRDFAEKPKKHGGFALDEAKVLIEIESGLHIEIPPFEEGEIQAYPKEKERIYHTITLPFKPQEIVDLLFFEHELMGVIALKNQQYLAEITMAPSGTGHAGLHIFPSLSLLEKRFGTDYTRLSSHLL